MSVKEIPKSYRYECDTKSCGFCHVQESAGGHYTDSRPEEWLKLIIFCEGQPRTDILLCPRCAIKMEKAINEITA